MSNKRFIKINVPLMFRSCCLQPRWCNMTNPINVFSPIALLRKPPTQSNECTLMDHASLPPPRYWTSKPRPPKSLSPVAALTSTASLRCDEKNRAERIQSFQILHCDFFVPSVDWVEFRWWKSKFSLILSIFLSMICSVCWSYVPRTKKVKEHMTSISVFVFDASFFSIDLVILRKECLHKK